MTPWIIFLLIWIALAHGSQRKRGHVSGGRAERDRLAMPPSVRHLLSMRHLVLVAHCERLLTTADCADENPVLQIKSEVGGLDPLEP
jgi:hypothetical protein